MQLQEARKVTCCVGGSKWQVALTILDIQLPEILAPLFEPKRYKIMYGGRGGGKSVSVAQALLAMGVQRPLRILCTREIQKSLKESVMLLLADLIKHLGLSAFYEVQATTIKGANGTTFLFSGLQDHTVDSIRSYTNVDIVWIEEAHSVSANSWETLTPTIRKDGSEIWATFNPVSEDDEVYRRFVTVGDPQAWVVKINWRDNRWFPAVLDAERRQMLAANSDLYQHIWEGQCRSVTGTIFKRAWVKWYDVKPANLTIYGASDWAFTPDGGDFTEHGVWGLSETGDLYGLDWWTGQTDPAVWIAAFIDTARRNKPRVWFEENGKDRRAMDSAINKAMREAKPRVFLQREGLPTVGNKVERAIGFAARMSSGAVYLPRGKEWAERLVNQLCAFTGEDGRVDDMVDVCGLIGRGLDSMVNAQPAAKDREPEIKPFTEKWLTYGTKKAKPRARYT